MARSGWTEVNKSAPCPACGKPDWCAWTDDGWLKCERCANAPEGMRLVSQKAGGAVFAPADEDGDGPRKVRGLRRADSPNRIDAKHATSDFAAFLEEARAAIDDDGLLRLADALGLPVRAVQAVGPGWADESLLRRLRAGGASWKEHRPDGAWVFAERDGAGNLVGLSLRAEDGRKGAPSGTKRGLVVPVSLADSTGPVLVVEGASDVMCCAALGLAAVGRPSCAAGANDLAQLLAGREVLVVGENDAKETGLWPGRDGAQKTAKALAVAWDRPVSWALPPDGAKDLRSWFTTRLADSPDRHDEAFTIAGRGLLKSLQSNAHDEATSKRGTADRLVDLAHEVYDLGVSDTGDPFAVRRDGHAIARMFRGNRGSLRNELAREFHVREGRTPSNSALSDALAVLEGEAADTDRRTVALRVASLPDASAGDKRDECDDPAGDLSGGIAVDIGDASGRAIVVTPGGWRVLDRSPVLFRRSALTAPLPEPERGGSLDDLRGLLNVDTESWPLVVGWLVSSLIPDIPHPILMFGGEQGTGKSTAAKLIGSLIDPSPAPLRSAPRDVEGWGVAASGSWIVALDNISGIPGWLSDTLCKAVTGDGIVRRALYTDSSVSVLRFRRCVILTSIDAGAMRGDLGDRLLLVELDSIADRQRRTEMDLDKRFRALAPRLLGALLDLLVVVLAVLPEVSLDEHPRMADFARVLAALDRVRPDLTGGRALATYLGQRGRVAEHVVEGDSVGEAIRDAINGRYALSGTAGDLLDLLRPERPPRDWPKNGQAFTSRLKRLRPALGGVGIHVEIPRTRTNRGRIITISRLDGDGREAPQSSRTSLEAASDDRGGVFGDDPRCKCDDLEAAGTPDRYRNTRGDHSASRTSDKSDDCDDRVHLLSANGTMPERKGLSPDDNFYGVMP